MPSRRLQAALSDRMLELPFLCQGQLARANRPHGIAHRQGTPRPAEAGRPSVDDRVSVFWNLLACDRSALASVSNQSAISSKPSVRAVWPFPGTCPCIRASLRRSPLQIRAVGRSAARSPGRPLFQYSSARARGPFHLRRSNGHSKPRRCKPSTSALDAEIQVTAVRLRLTGERVFQIVLGLRTFSFIGFLPSGSGQLAIYGRPAIDPLNCYYDLDSEYYLER